METSTWNLPFDSPFFLTVLTNGLIIYNSLIYDFNNDGHNAATADMPSFHGTVQSLESP